MYCASAPSLHRESTDSDTTSSSISCMTDEVPSTGVYSNQHILTLSSQIITFPTASITRSDPVPTTSWELFICVYVVDYPCPHTPICAEDVLVPYYPGKSEMVIIKGTSDETWLGHIQSRFNFMWKKKSLLLLTFWMQHYCHSFESLVHEWALLVALKHAVGLSQHWFSFFTAGIVQRNLQ